MYAYILHAHQKIDRTAHRHLQVLGVKRGSFPTVKQILHFEGPNGPDGTKLKKKTNVEQPWHFIDPFDVDDNQLMEQIEDHYNALAKALKKQDMIRAAFEAAWLAHALVDGLTPAHHYPYEKELEHLHGVDRQSRKGLAGRVFVKGDTTLQSMHRSFKLMGPKGLLTTHTMFEAGAFTIMAPLRLTKAIPNQQELDTFKEIGVVDYFQRIAREVAALDLYKRFYEKGWTPALSRDIRRELATRMVMVVTVAWYSALQEALDANR